MKKLSNLKWFSMGMVACLIISVFIVPAVAASFSKTETLHYNNIGIKLNGQTIMPKDPNGKAVDPFIINGTTYLPVRAVSEALGLKVDWDNTTDTVVMTGNTGGEDAGLGFVQLLGYYEMIRTKFDELSSGFGSMGDDIQWVMDTVITSGPFAGRTLCDATVIKLGYDIATVEEHFNGCWESLTDEGIDLWHEYKRLANLSISYYKELDGNPTSGFINRVVGAARENMISSDVASGMATVLFWEDYQYAFS